MAPNICVIGQKNWRSGRERRVNGWI
jgi:hypothetical protein